MSKQTGYVRNIFFSLFISVLILLGIGFLSIKYLIPLYDIGSQDIYKFMIYLLPILIGLALIEIGSIIASSEVEAKADVYDLLPKNSYDKPLYSALNDDPSISNIVAPVEDVFAPVASAIVSPMEEQIIEPVIAPIVAATTESDLPNDLQSQLLALNEEDASRLLAYLNSGESIVDSSLNEDLTEQLLSLDEDEANRVIDCINSGSDISSVFAEPLPFDENTNEAITNFTQEEAVAAVAYVKNGPLVAEQVPEIEESEFDGSLSAVLQSEIDNSIDFGYDVSLVLLNLHDTMKEETKDIILESVNSACYSFEMEDGSIYLVFPMFKENEVTELLSKTIKNLPSRIGYGISSVKSRENTSSSLLIEEAVSDYKCRT